jgi:hypothetical protein
MLVTSAFEVRTEVAIISVFDPERAIEADKRHRDR